ncbi:hypothetical protein AB0L63_05020 [Nocardia sp. NPDC051990]|uniref:hypothetical protein n=1 Tax=Nocardia sp. NPDC051990 TaxID=3155285 RepID=UPI00342AE320
MRRTGARRTRIAPGETVVVIGLGPAGLMAVQPAFAMGASRVLGVDLVAERRSCSIPYELPALLRLTGAGRIRPEAVVTHRFPMSDGANTYRMFADRADGVSKVVLDPRQ